VDLHAHAWVDAFRDYGHQVDFEKVRAQIGKGGDELMPVFLSEAELKQYGEELENHRPLDDGKQIVLASSAKEDELETYKKAADIEDLIRAETSADDAEKSKPHPDIFEEAIKRLDVRPEEVIVVGDTPYDAEAAAKAGLRTIGLLCGGWSNKELKDADCIAIYKDPADLLMKYDKSPLVRD
jgi:HAD superfamily hydrolase (TIGR01549 family)